MTKKYKIAMALAASSGFHKSVGREMFRLVANSSQYEMETFFTGFDHDLMVNQLIKMQKNKFDAIVTVGYIFTRTALNVLSQYEENSPPVVFAGVKWPVEQGIINSIRRPGGFMTGVLREGPSPLMQAYLIEHLPMKISKIVIPYSPYSEGGYLLEQSTLIKNYLAHRNIEVEVVAIELLETAVETVDFYINDGVDLVLFLEGCMLGEVTPALAHLCKQRGVLLFGDGDEAVRAGADLGYGGNNQIFAKKAFSLVRKICEQELDPGELSMSCIGNNRTYSINRRLVEDGVLSKKDIDQLKVVLSTKIHLVREAPQTWHSSLSGP